MAKIALFEGTLRIERGWATVMAVVNGDSRLTIPLVGNLPPDGIYRTKGFLYRFAAQYALHVHSVEIARDPHGAHLIGSADQFVAEGCAINRTGHFDAEWLALFGDHFFVSDSETTSSSPHGAAPSGFQEPARDVIEIVSPLPPSSERAATGPQNGTPSGPETFPTMPPDQNASSEVVVAPRKRSEPFPVTTKPEPLLHGPPGTIPRIQGAAGASSPVRHAASLPEGSGQEQSVFASVDATPLAAQKQAPPKAKGRRSKEDRQEAKPSAGITAEEIQKFSF